MLIRDLSNAVEMALRNKAARKGMSLEAYARHVLVQDSREPVTEILIEEPQCVAGLAETYFGKDGGVTLDLAPRTTKRFT